jgi:hypothetical protein
MTSTAPPGVWIRNPKVPWRHGPLGCVIVLGEDGELLILDRRSAQIWDRAESGVGHCDLVGLLGADPPSAEFPSAASLFEDLIARNLLIEANDSVQP